MISDWHTIAQANTLPLRPTAHGQSRGIAMVQGAVYDAVNADKVEITVVSGRSLNGEPIPPRTIERFSDATEEIIDARVWGGIHFRTADVAGTVIGKHVAHWVRHHFFQPLH